ncbi:MAG: O-antigen ligase family protein, partial [Thermoguttaceae bacterium]
MARLALTLALVVSALGILQNKLFELIGLPPILFSDLALMLPAVMLGSFYWWKGRSYASSWPVVLCVALVWVSLLYPGNVERTRGLLIAALVTIPLPLAALMVESRSWTFCAKVYVWANAVAMAAAIWFESRVENSFLSLVGRFGFLVSADGSSHTANPNQVGGQFAFASVVAFILYLKSSETADDANRPRFPDVYLLLMVMLSIGCMMTASRGAFVAWFPAVGMLFFLGTRQLPMARLRDLVVLSVMGLLFVLALVAADRDAPWEKLAERLGDKREIGNLSNRSDVWFGALEAWQSDPDFVWRGTGIGMADDVLGEFSPNPDEDDEGVLRKNCHNAAIEWVLSLGLVGIAVGCCLGGSVVYQMCRLDGQDRNVGRTAMIICLV